MSNGTQVDRWMVRIVTLLGAALVAMSCYFVWRISMVAYRMEQAVVEISSDIRVVTGTAADLAVKIDELSNRVARLAEKSSDAIGLDELETALDGIAELRRGRDEPTSTIDPRTEGEIRYLLDTAILRSGKRFEWSGKSRSAAGAYAYFLAKYKLYEKTLTSAEDFVDKVATRTLTGRPYQVLVDGRRQPLDQYLLEALGKRRQRGEEPQPAAPEQTPGRP